MTEVMSDGEELLFVRRVSELALVDSTVSYVNSWYEWSKEKSRVVKYGCGVAERTLGAVSGVVKPYVARVDRPLHYVDGLACRQLEKLERRVPVLTKTPAQIGSDAREKTLQVYDTVKTSAIATTTTLATGVLDTCLENRFAKPIVRHVLDYVELGLDKVMPAEQRSSSKSGHARGQEKSYERAMTISRRTYKRLRTLTDEKVDEMKTHASAAVQRLQAVAELATTVSLLSQTKDTYDAALTRLNQLWHDVSERFDIDNTLPLNQKLHLLSLRLAQNVISAFNGISATLGLLPERLRSQFASRLDFVHSLRSTVAASVHDSPLPSLFENSQEKLAALVLFVNEWADVLKERLASLPAAWQRRTTRSKFD